MGEPVLVVIFLRGGADALALVGPTADADYVAARPADLRVARGGDEAGHRLGDGLADVDFRLHPAMGDLATLFHAGDLSILHATGLAEVTRSHFDAEARIERAATGTSDGMDPRGWLGRWLAHAAPEGPLPALAVGASLPGSLRGSMAAQASSLEDLMLAPGHWLAPALRARLARGFGRHGTLGASATEVLALSRLLEDRFWLAEAGAARAYEPSVEYPGDSPLSAPLMTVAQTIKAGLGLRVATVDYGGWDTHADQAGELAFLASGLSRALMAFWRDLGSLQPDVAVLVQSEFGRRLRANASAGTDHGRAGAMMLLGPQARGGRLLGRWPGLSNADLEEGADLAVTTDHRHALYDVLTAHMGLREPGAVFPGLAPEPTGL